MTTNHKKKSPIPFKVRSSWQLHFEHVNLISCNNAGIVLKNILSFSKIVCVPRDGISNKIVKNKLLEIHPQAQIHFLKNVDEKISSTTIKGFITLGGTFDENSYLTLSTNAPLSGHLQYLNKNVYTYILKNKIYL